MNKFRIDYEEGKISHPDKNIPCSDVITEEATKIDAVIKALKELTDIKTADYTSTGKALMIDITREIEVLLKEYRDKNNGALLS